MSHFDISPQKVLHLWKEEEKKNPKIDGDYIVTCKIDGWFCFIDYSVTHGWSFVSNENRIIPSFIWTRGWFEKLPKFSVDLRLIMEAYIPETPFHILNGIFNRKEEDAKDVHFVIHDVIFPDNLGIKNYDRFLWLNNLQIAQSLNTDRLSTMPLCAISSFKDTWMRWFELITEKGGEGVVLKSVDGVYTPGKRNSSLMKIKCEEEFDLLAIDYYKTIGEKGNDAWNLLLKTKNGKTQSVRVGKDEDIANFALYSPVGKVHQIKCMKRLPDGSFREPTYVGIREDKNITEID